MTKGARCRHSVLMSLAIWLGLLSCVQASEFLRLCQQSMAKAESFLAECRAKARPFKRVFLPGGHGPPSPEEHAAWFDPENGGSHFGFGCVLGGKGEVRYLGIYFALQPSSFRLANSAPFSFVDFQGNVGLRPSERNHVTFLAVHKFTPPGTTRTHWDRNCEIGRYDPATNETADNRGHGFYFHRVNGEDPAEITQCSSREPEYRYIKENCHTRYYKSFLSSDRSAVIYSDASIKITESARLYVERGILDKICSTSFRSAREFINFIAELCR
jgi:hypothetical protein